MSAPTPGDWFVEDDGKLGLYVVSDFGNIARVMAGAIRDDETLPNAYLLASAPALLRALKKMVRDHDEMTQAGFGVREDADHARLAIALSTCLDAYNS